MFFLQPLENAWDCIQLLKQKCYYIKMEKKNNTAHLNLNVNFKMILTVLKGLFCKFEL